MADHEVMAQLVDFTGRDARSDMGRDHVQRFGGETASLAHAREILGAINGNATRLAALLLHRAVHKS